jgi:predicted Zn-dependent protease
MISTPSEVSMGKNVHRSIAQQYKVLDDSEKLERIRRIGDRLAVVSDRRDYKYNFHLIEKDEMNAFTTPGGNIYVYTGLLDKLKSDDQIAAVIAHEIGHCAARHTVKKFQAALSYNILSSLIISQIEEDKAKRVTALSANTLMSIVFSGYSRQDEHEADRLGIKYMHLACFDPAASIETFEVLKSGSKGWEGILLFRSHPYIQDRIRDIRGEIPLLERKYGPRPSPCP